MLMWPCTMTSLIFPIKTVAFDSIVGMIIGTPLIAATVGHGTAFEIAGKGVANPRPMIEAIEVSGQKL